MPLESCMILLDNSQYMRNGDYLPTRMEAQSDAANMIVSQKTQSNPESTVGVIAMVSSSAPSSGGGAGAELLVSPTDDLGKILSALHKVPLAGGGITPPAKDAVDIAASVQVATLALKHRRNKNGAQRIVLFVGSPLNNADKKSLVKAGKQLKKNNVFIDVVCLGELDVNEGKLRELVDAANGSSGSNAEGGEGEGERNCHLVTIPAGVLPSDVLISSPILRGDGGYGSGGGGVGGGGGDMGGDAFADFGGVDPSMDPELAMALRVSMEEERARQERVAAAAAAAANNEGGGEGDNAALEGQGGNGVGAEGATGGGDTMQDMNDEDALLQQALAMSMAENQGDMVAAGDASGNAGAAEGMDEDEDEDAAMQAALAMSMQDDGEEKAAEEGAQFQDPQFVNQLLGSMPGVDPNDPAIQEALRKANEDARKKDDDKDESKE
mmetsp:Transcript_10398/g.22256  ORF Transcript_10398/g.22256 Transcript_10398/m.22256 type:complete len:439 (-) Transcript_10398:335-1651(-)|eukprot:CAMPEP_0171334246 /NCGR_PEP_ID=MMETSP0878-20121228/4545_1 /TAXON_ID=67004 /ORGANISM="Thalassiosira weissflogii, Strain CCMP1336" /LENGTH=438 /DNA_ID=CAMNT_0011835317 /DNA_START=193 /DNA_END=1509 /DNA_ORIENTATION=+